MISLFDEKMNYLLGLFGCKFKQTSPKEGPIRTAKPEIQASS
ncbi:hypothetical protein ACE38V_17215 [Cytobacillus sp. Hz8]